MKIILIIILPFFLSLISIAKSHSFKAEIKKTNSKRGKWCVTISNMETNSVFIANPDLGHVAISYKNETRTGTYNGHKNKKFENEFYKNLALLNARHELDNKDAEYVFFLPDIGVDFSDPKLVSTICIWSWQGVIKNQGYETTFYPLQYKISQTESKP